MTAATENSDGQSFDAKDLIGEPQPDHDWKLEPEAHAARLDDKAIALRRVLDDEAITEIMRRYDRHDKLAGDHQAMYKRYGRWEIYLGTAAAILGAIVLLMTDSKSLTPAYNTFRIALLIIQIVCTAGLVSFKYFLQHRKLFVKWQKERSEAETARIELFETACGLSGRKWNDAERADDFPLLPLQLEYFVRYQLLVQIAYYSERGAEHEVAANRYIGFGAIVTFVAALAAAIVGFSHDLGDAVSIASLAALVAPILLTAQTSLSRLNQDERNAARYAITHDHLDRLRGKLSDARKKAASGLVEPVHAFIRSANEVISVEHSQWLVQQSEASAVGKSD